MAEEVGLAASIVQIASTGIRLSTALCNFAGGAGRAEQDIADIADHVKTIAVALDGVGRIIGQDDGTYEPSKNAISEAGGLTKRCEAVFGEAQSLMEMNMKLGNNEKKTPVALDKSKEQSAELLRRRLDSVKHSIMLLMHVLQLANGQARGNMEESVLIEERETIRALHQRQQDSVKALQALESKLDDGSLSDSETLGSSIAPSRVPTINFLVNSSALGASFARRTSDVDMSTVQALADNSETPDSDDTVTDDDGEQLTVDELAQCANHVRELLKRITVLRQSCEPGNAQSNRRLPRNRVLKSYRRFCRKFESAMAVQDGATPAAAPLLEIVPTSQQSQHVQIRELARESQPQAHHPSKALPDPTGIATDRVAHTLLPIQDPQNKTSANRPATEGHYTLTTPAWTISSEPLGPGSRPKLPPLISTVPRANQASPINEILSPGDDQDAKYSGTDGDGEQGSHESGPVVYTKTGRISKAKKGLKVHTCEQCGRSFTRAEHLRRHQKNHGPNQVRCELCGKVFFRADLLQRHLERHKDLPQGYRFSNAPVSSTEGASPTATDEAYHRHILPAPRISASSMPPHHSPSGRSVDSSGASGAPTPSENPAASPAAVQQPRSAWETANAQSVVPHAPEENATQRQHAWQPINIQERRQESSETTQAHVSSPSVQQQLHPGRPKLQPRVRSANGASIQKRYSNILPAPGVPNTQHQHMAYPQGHMPNMLPRQCGTSSTQAAPKTAAGPTGYYDPSRMGQGPRASPGMLGGQMNHNERIVPRSPTAASSVVETGLPMQSIHSRYQAGIQSPLLPTLGNSPGNTSRSLPTGIFAEDERQIGSRLLEDGHRPGTEIASGKLSSDRDGVNWRVAVKDPRSYRRRREKRTLSRTDGDSSGTEDIGDGSMTHRDPRGTDRSYSGSRSLSLVIPQNERDLALLRKTRPQDRQLAELVSPHGGPPLTALSPNLVGMKSASRPSTGVSDARLQVGSGASASGNVADESESPRNAAPEEQLDPESPYSLATIKRYIRNQGPQPGVGQGEDMAATPSQASRAQEANGETALFQVSRPTGPCERCREYSIKCDGKLPTCTACATTKYAGECSFSSLPSHSTIPMAITQGPPVAKCFENISATTRQAMMEPRGQTVQPPVTETPHPDQEYSGEDDLPSPYLKPRDKGHHTQAMARIPSIPLDNGNDPTPAKAQGSKKRKAGGEQRDGEEPGAKVHERKKSKGNHTEEETGNAKDIVDVLLKEWTVPVS